MNFNLILSQSPVNLVKKKTNIKVTKETKKNGKKDLLLFSGSL